MNDKKNQNEIAIGFVVGFYSIVILTTILAAIFHKYSYDVRIAYLIAGSSFGLLVSFYTWHMILNRNRYSQSRHTFFALVCFGSSIGIMPLAIYSLSETPPDLIWIMYVSSISLFVTAATAALSIAFGHPKDTTAPVNTT
ncbi:MAG: hypothetical protein WC788_06950 [Candidatus Paceibacterota bacterium]|jgi:peptidoglycan/LPS O-acetylase OafA/YrhL